MSKYTTELRYICEHFSDLNESVGYYKVNEVIEKSREKIFNFEYPIFDEKYRSVIETKILKHYYTREIGVESVGLWLLKLETKLNEVMPYFNKLYNSELLEFNPFYDVDVKTTSKRTTNTNSITKAEDKTNVDNDSVDRVLYSDTPQGSLKNVENETYLTNATKTLSEATTNSTSNSNSENNINNLDDYIDNVIGKRGGESFSKMLMEFRETFINIDLLVIDALSDLFMNIW